MVTLTSTLNSTSHPKGGAMNRRQFTTAGLSAVVAGSANLAAQAAEQSHFYEFRTYELRNDLEPARLDDFFRDHYLPALKKLGAGPVGCFKVTAGQLTPALIVLIDYPSLSLVRSNTQLIRSDAALAREWKKFETSSGLPFVRYQSALLRAFDAHPKVEIPARSADGSPHLFELRTYESKDSFDSEAKIDMFNQEEIQIFRDCGFDVVFFGEGVFGNRLPHLSYMVAFEDFAAREKGWDTFRKNPDWIRIRNKPVWAGTVSSIHASFLSPTDYSEVR
jgi:hypothetical protein